MCIRDRNRVSYTPTNADRRYKIGASVITNYTVRRWKCGRMHGNIASRHSSSLGLMPPLPPPRWYQSLPNVCFPQADAYMECRMQARLAAEWGEWRPCIHLSVARVRVEWPACVYDTIILGLDMLWLVAIWFLRITSDAANAKLSCLLCNYTYNCMTCTNFCIR